MVYISILKEVIELSGMENGMADRHILGSLWEFWMRYCFKAIVYVLLASCLTQYANGLSISDGGLSRIINEVECKRTEVDRQYLISKDFYDTFQKYIDLVLRERMDDGEAFEFKYKNAEQHVKKFVEDALSLNINGVPPDKMTSGHDFLAELIARQFVEILHSAELYGSFIPDEKTAQNIYTQLGILQEVIVSILTEKSESKV